MDIDKKQLIKRLKEIDIIHREPIVLASGQRADFYIDIKKSYGYPDVRQMVAGLLLESISQDATCIAASGYGGIPLATDISSSLGLKLALIRDTPKSHGRATLIDGYVPNHNDRICLVDDVFTTGKSLNKIAEALSGFTSRILSANVAVRRTTLSFPLKLNYLFTAEDLI